MPLYSYLTINHQGHYQKGDWFGASKTQLYRELKQKNSRLIWCQPTRKLSLTRFWLTKVKIDDLMHFCVHLEQMMAVKIPLSEGILLFLGRPLSRSFKEILMGVYHLLHQGHLLSKAAKAYPLAFDAVFCEFVRVAEKTGGFAEAFKQLTTYYQAKKLYRQHLAQSLRYPVILLLGVSSLFVFIGVIFLPQLTNHLNQTHQQTPPLLKTLTGCLQFLEAYGLFFGLISLILGGVGYSLTKSSSWARCWVQGLVLRLPYVGQLKGRIMINKFLQTLALLLRTKMELLTAFEKSLQGVTNLFLTKELSQAYSRLQNGFSLSEALAKSLTGLKVSTPILQRYIQMGEETGNLAHLLQQATEAEFKQIHHHLRTLVSWLEPTLLGIAGALLLWVVVAILLPLYDGLSLLQT